MAFCCQVSIPIAIDVLRTFQVPLISKEINYLNSNPSEVLIFFLEVLSVSVGVSGGEETYTVVPCHSIFLEIFLSGLLWNLTFFFFSFSFLPFLGLNAFGRIVKANQEKGKKKKKN